MKDHAAVTIRDDGDGKTAQERFASLGKKLMAVPKAQVDAREKASQPARKRARKRR